MIFSKRISIPLLMVISIVVVAGFQAYWLKDSYDREAKALEIRANMSFQEAVREEQATKLKINYQWNAADSAHVADEALPAKFSARVPPPEPPEMEYRQLEKEDLVTVVRILDEKMKDSLQDKAVRQNKLMITMKDRNEREAPDSIHGNVLMRSGEKGGRFFEFLYQVDSLQDSIGVKELSEALTKKLKTNGVSIPFSITRKDSIVRSGRPAPNEVVVGFTKPVQYRMEMGNTLPFLLGKITLPILFSVFLIGLTILSFTLLYRNLLKQQRLVAIRNELVSNITHELKTPIATVGVAIEALRNFSAIKDPVRTRAYLDISANELQRLSLLVDKVLKLSMFEREELHVQLETVNLQDVVSEVVSSMRLQFEKQHADVQTAFQGDLTVKADKLHMLSVVFNLLDNALKYGGPTPEIRVTGAVEDSSVVIRVADNGIGIEPAFTEKIFDKFFRVPGPGSTHNAKGHGLGLSYVAEVVRRHHGQIKVVSEPGKGSTFIITIPKGTT